MKNNLIYFLSITIISLFAVSCNDIDFEGSGEKVVGNGDIQTEMRDVDNFEKLQISHVFNVELEQGDEYKVVIEAESNLMEYLISEVENGTLKLKRKKGFRLKTKTTPIAVITMPSLKKIEFHGAGSLSNNGVFEAENLSLQLSGASEIDLNLDCESLDTQLSGASEIDLEGNADRFRASTSGAGNIDAEDFITEISDVSVSGAASVKVHATETLKARISGVGSIRYAGNPKEVNKSVSGLGSIKKI